MRASEGRGKNTQGNGADPATGERRLPLPVRRLALAAFLLVAAGCAVTTRTTPLGVSDRAPAFSLPDQQGRTTSLNDLLREGPAVILFYRGHW